MINFKDYILIEKALGGTWSADQIDDMTPELLKNLSFIRNNKSKFKKLIPSMLGKPKDTLQFINYQFLENGIIFINIDLVDFETDKSYHTKMKVEKGKLKTFKAHN